MFRVRTADTLRARDELRGVNVRAKHQFSQDSVEF
jgi:hypothetical protein